ncbi:MAG: DNA mismatch repair protein MutL [Candidatus Ordinivivax streblomastigis]|uniref:DNA mismatch repair protein MutL n=1 Tax=Candidatus Ordinivivax streblomastigis TaxID=2540710 RepID=A0A5M8NZZ5_9BACT|nr:MAG: DNA mismatch repair protein MutL [Candidatus Ordinivivax streblomastigis]
MSDIIHLLSDSIANQIAAGEVIQRPASVVKELVENAVDAGADRVQVLLKKSGTLLIQVIDNGRGMSETDARMAFERHATSKISSAQDLFALRSLGFRGEALASIAAVAQVELKTRRKEDETGTLIQISASQIEKQEPVAMNPGSSFSIRNLFFNIPVRRKFLKTPETELKNILTEFERVALVYPQVVFTLWDDTTEIFSLPVSNLKQRIINVTGKKIAPTLLPIAIETSFIRISGFIGTPDSSRKRGSLQYFFVNGRYMRHPYFHRAVMMAFEPFLPAGEQPNYFIYFDIDPSSIDVNIHPTKTEIKFENEQMLFQVITSSVKEAIAVPALEFDREGAIDIPVYDPHRTTPVEAPNVQLRSDYNPFKETQRHSYERPKLDWEKLYEKQDASSDGIPVHNTFFPNDQQENRPDSQDSFLQHKGRYLITSLKSGLTIIDQRRAHIRILFDDYIRRMTQKQGVSQKLLFPEMIAFTPKQAAILPCILDDLAFIGFDLANLGGNTYSINGIPAGLENVDTIETLRDMVEKVLETGCEITEEITESLALALAQKAAISYGKALSEEEAQSLIAKLFSSDSPNYTPDGKMIVSILSEEEVGKRFK